MWTVLRHEFEVVLGHNPYLQDRTHFGAYMFLGKLSKCVQGGHMLTDWPPSITGMAHLQKAFI